MTRTERLLRLAKLRGDRVAVAILEGPRLPDRSGHWLNGRQPFVSSWTEAELRAAWGDR